MTSQICMILPSGEGRCYKLGQRVRVHPGCPKLPAGVPGGVGEITVFVNGDEVIVRLDGVAELLGPIPAESLYLCPIDEVVA